MTINKGNSPATRSAFWRKEGREILNSFDFKVFFVAVLITGLFLMALAYYGY